VVLMLYILEPFRLRHIDPVQGIFDVAEDWSSRPVAVPLQPDTVYIAQDN
jgi:hypothetical protein